MTTWNYRVFREESGEYVIREVFYDEEGSILGCTENAVLPMGESLEELTQDLDYFKEALQLSVLTLGEVDAAVALAVKSALMDAPVGKSDLDRKTVRPGRRAKGLRCPGRLVGDHGLVRRHLVDAHEARASWPRALSATGPSISR